MEFSVKEGRETRVELSGKLDFSRAPALMKELEKLKGKDVSSVVFECNGLTYISSAGIRAIIFARQKISPDMTVVLENAAEDVVEVLDMCGLSDFIEFRESKG